MLVKPMAFAEERPHCHMDENVKGIPLDFQKRVDLTLAHCRWKACPFHRVHLGAAQLDEVKG